MDLGLHLCAVLSCPRCPLSTVPWSFVQLSSAGISASAYLPRCHVRGPLSPWQKTLLLLRAFRWPQKLHFSCRHCLALCPFLLRLLRIWALELRSPVAFAPMTNGLCCMYFPHGGFIATGCVCLLREAPGKPAWEHELVFQGGEHVGLLQAQTFGADCAFFSARRRVFAQSLFGSRCRTRDGHVQFWTAPRVLSSLKHLCRKALRTFLTTYQVLALPIPRKLKEFLTYRTF